jgi:elongation factor Ts
MKELIEKLRKETNMSLTVCIDALKNNDADYSKAKQAILEKNKKIILRVADRIESEGIVEAYIHHNKKVGVLIELECETDSVAKNEDLIKLARTIAMHIASAKPKYISVDDIDEEEYKRIETECYVGIENKPPQIQEKIVAGKLDKHFSECVLLKQKFVADEKRTIYDLIQDVKKSLGENIKVRRFSRFDIKE